MSIFALDYGDYALREDLHASHEQILDHLRRPGSWLRGAERLAVAAESRSAAQCGLCRERKAALSPEHARGEHATHTGLAPALVEVAHRVRTDPGRVTRKWFDGLLGAGLDEGRYVEAVGIVALVAGIDAMCHALGIEVLALPEPVDGAPSGHRPDGLSEGIAWVPLLTPENAIGPEADLYGGVPMVPNIMRALSLVPDHVRVLRGWLASHYTLDLLDLTVGRAIDRAQMELVAARVSAINECFY